MSRVFEKDLVLKTQLDIVRPSFREKIKKLTSDVEIHCSLNYYINQTPYS